MKKTNLKVKKSLLNIFLICTLTAIVHMDAMGQNAFDHVIPKPVSVKSGEGFFNIHSNTNVVVDGTASNVTGEFLKGKLDDLANGTTQGDENIVLLRLDKHLALPSSGYRVLVDLDTITLEGADSAGLFYAVQTLLQLIPISGASVIPTGEIVDYPNYAYRGIMLDVARHFFSVDEVLSFIDLMSHYKLNHLHLHLTDDQGWRIEITSWPKLTEIGGSTAVGGDDGGYYTQKDYARIVEYAAQKYITVVPEIDMPGHTNAALASYPELNCNDKAPSLYTGIKVGFSSLCTDKEITYQFVDDVVRELAAITPGRLFHIGGDESHSTEKSDYVTFIDRAEEIVSRHGKTMVGWDEIVHADLGDKSVVQYWNSVENLDSAMKKKLAVILSPSSLTYLDMKYDSTTKLGQDWAGLISVRKAYDWSFAELSGQIKPALILGVEAPLWTETIRSVNDLEYMAFPRLLGLAEIGWTPAKDRSWDSYVIRLAAHGKRLKALEVNFFPSNLVPWEK